MIDLSEFGIVSIGATPQVQSDDAKVESTFEGVTFGEVRSFDRSATTRGTKLSDRIKRGPPSYKKIRMSEPQPMTCTVCNADDVHIIFTEHNVTVGCILCNPTYIRRNWRGR